MKLALIAATGFVGSAVLQEALDRGHEVTAIERHRKSCQCIILIFVLEKAIFTMPMK